MLGGGFNHFSRDFFLPWEDDPIRLVHIFRKLGRKKPTIFKTNISLENRPSQKESSPHTIHVWYNLAPFPQFYHKNQPNIPCMDPRRSPWSTILQGGRLTSFEIPNHRSKKVDLVASCRPPQGSAHQVPCVLKELSLYCKWIWSNHSDLTRPHPKWWSSKENPLISGKPRLVKYYDLARLDVFWKWSWFTDLPSI